MSCSSFGELILTVRGILDLTQQDFAEVLGVKSRGLQSWEATRGKVRNSRKKLRALEILRERYEGSHHWPQISGHLQSFHEFERKDSGRDTMVQRAIDPPQSRQEPEIIKGVNQVYQASIRILQEAVSVPGRENIIKATTIRTYSVSAYRREYLEAKERIVKEEEWYCNDLLLLLDVRPDSLQEVAERIRRFRNAPSYSLAIHRGSPLYYQRMIIVNGEIAHIRLPSNLEYDDAGNSLIFRDKETVSIYEEWFDELWARSDIVKDRQRLDTERLSSQYNVALNEDG